MGVSVDKDKANNGEGSGKVLVKLGCMDFFCLQNQELMPEKVEGSRL